MNQPINFKNYSDQQISQYIDQVFSRYDYNHNNSLGPLQLANFFNQMFAMMGYPTRVQGPKIQKLFNDLDRNHDGGVSREQIFVLFKKLLSV